MIFLVLTQCTLQIRPFDSLWTCCIHSSCQRSWTNLDKWPHIDSLFTVNNHHDSWQARRATLYSGTSLSQLAVAACICTQVAGKHFLSVHFLETDETLLTLSHTVPVNDRGSLGDKFSSSGNPCLPRLNEVSKPRLFEGRMNDVLYSYFGNFL